MSFKPRFAKKKHEKVPKGTRVFGLGLAGMNSPNSPEVRTRLKRRGADGELGFESASRAIG